MAQEFKVGDVVKLKSGGPKMTIETLAKVNAVPPAHCAWFTDKEEKRNDYFPLEALQLA